MGHRYGNNQYNNVIVQIHAAFFATPQSMARSLLALLCFATVLSTWRGFFQTQGCLGLQSTVMDSIMQGDTFVEQQPPSASSSSSSSIRSMSETQQELALSAAPVALSQSVSLSSAKAKTTKPKKLKLVPAGGSASSPAQLIKDDQSNNQNNNNNKNNNGHQNKTLVIIMGSLRGGENTWNTLYKNVLDENLADLAMAVGENPNKTSSLYRRAKYLWEFQEYDDWADALDLINNNDKSWRIILEYKGLDEILGGIKGFKGSGAIIFWIRWFISNKLKELDLLKQYDRFVVTRSDHYYLCKHDLSQLDSEDVWVPNGEDYRGVTDRHVVAPSSKILAVLDIYPWLLANPLEAKDLWKTRAGARPERFIKSRWRKMGIKERRFNRMMFTCAVPGDITRWGKPQGEVMMPTGPLWLKYPLEYYAAKKTCPK